eukprot:2291691-Prymnesium_polylepis.1
MCAKAAFRTLGAPHRHPPFARPTLDPSRYPLHPSRNPLDAALRLPANAQPKNLLSAGAQFEFDPLQAAWEERLQQLAAALATGSSLPLPLRRWASRQKAAHREGSLSAER